MELKVHYRYIINTSLNNLILILLTVLIAPCSFSLEHLSKLQWHVLSDLIVLSFLLDHKLHAVRSFICFAHLYILRFA